MRDMSNRGSLGSNSNHGRGAGNTLFEAWLPHNLYKSNSSSTHSENNNNNNASCSTSRVAPGNFTSSSGPRISENLGTNLANNNPDHPPRARNIAREQIDGRYNNNNSSKRPENFVPSGRYHSSGSRAGLSSGGPSRSLPLLPHEMLMLSESDSSVLPPFDSSSSNETETTSRARRQSDMPGGRINGPDVSSAVARRNIRDYLLIDPLNGFVESCHRHTDMSVDVDNMSYEELLALEERIGNVSSGVSEEKIRKSTKQSKYEAIRASPNLEPCCICQEDYVAGDDIGKLNCGHEFHIGCIIQWLILKNTCPICKTTAVGRT